MNSSHAPIGIRKNHVLWAVGAIVLAILLFFPSDSETDIGTPETSAQASSGETAAAASPSFADIGVATFARSEPVEVDGESNREEIAAGRQQTAGAGENLSSPTTRPVASAAVATSVFAAGEPYTANASGCGSSAAGCARR